VNKILDDVERPCEDKREEKAEPCKVHVALRAWWSCQYNGFIIKAVYELEFARSDRGLRSNIVNALSAGLGDFNLRSDTKHALERIDEQDADESDSQT
jgi:hypothetical protein